MDKNNFFSLSSNIFSAKVIRILVLIIAAVVVIALIFSAGVFVGSRKARFSCAWGDAYHNNFAGHGKEFPVGPMREINDRFPEINDKEFMNPNGVFGKIIKITKAENNTSSLVIIISGGDGLERNIVVDNKTNIKIFRDDVKVDALKTDQFVTVIGDTDNGGQINAKLIRVMPAPRNNGTFLK